MEARNQACLTCHQGAKRIHWRRARTRTATSTCTSCHQVHAPHDRVRDKRDPDRHLLHLPQGAARADATARRATRSARASGLLRATTRTAATEAAGARQRQRHLLHLPHGEARAVRAHPPAGAGRLRDLPQPARHDHRQPAEGAPAVPVPAVPQPTPAIRARPPRCPTAHHQHQPAGTRWRAAA